MEYRLRPWSLSTLYCTWFDTYPQSDLVTTNTLIIVYIHIYIYIYIYIYEGHSIDKLNFAEGVGIWKQFTVEFFFTEIATVWSFHFAEYCPKNLLHWPQQSSLFSLPESQCVFTLLTVFSTQDHNHHHHHVALLARISLAFSIIHCFR